MLISVGWLPPYWCPSRRLLRSRREDRGLVTRSKVAPKTGAASPPMARDRHSSSFTRRAIRTAPSCWHRNGPSDRPGECRHLAGNRHDDLVHVLASRAQLSVSFAQPHLGLPPDRLHLGGQLL